MSQSLEEMLAANSRAQVCRALDEIENTGQRNLIPQILQLMETTQDDIIRNTAAMTLRGLNACEAVPLLISLAQKHSPNHSGTLIYALQICDCSQNLPEIVTLMCTENFEQREMCFQIVEKHINLDLQIRNRCLETLTQYKITNPSATALEYVDEAIKILTGFNTD